MPRNPKTARRRIRNREHLAQAMELRKAGASFQQIGDKLKLTRQRAFQLVSEGLQELNAICTDKAEELRRLDLERLDSLLLSLYPQRSNPRVADSILRTMERRAKLLGLDAPQKVAQTTPDGDALPPALDLSKLTTKELLEWRALAAKATPESEG
jgi:hypothetical protein